MKNLCFSLCTILFLSFETYPQDKVLNTILENLEVELVEPGIVSTSDFEFGTTLSPNESTLFFVKGLPGFQRTVIVYVEKEDDQWSEPKVAPFSGIYNDTNPYFSKQGNRLYFTSNRPSGIERVRGSNIWYVEKIRDDWSEPKLVKGEINDEFDIIYPTIQTDGTIHFVSWNRPNSKNGDIYISKLENGKYSQPELVDELNTLASDADPEVSPDSKYMFLVSQRKGGYGHYDLYVSKRQSNGVWGELINLGPKVNTFFMDSDPVLSPDGETLFFSSDKFDTTVSSASTYNSYDSIVKFYNKIQNGRMNIYKVEIKELLTYLESNY
ncbi:MAG: hypothetical protein AAGA43_11115 [Bacteroidota bacterium]